MDEKLQKVYEVLYDLGIPLRIILRIMGLTVKELKKSEKSKNS